MATRPGASRAQASTEIAATGLRLCGMPRSRRGRARRLAHLADLVLGQQHEIGGRLAERRRRPRPARWRARRCGCGRRARGARLGQAELACERGEHLRAAVAERGQRARAAAELDGQALAADGVQAAAAASSAVIQPRGLSPKVVGTACWSSVRPAIGVARWRGPARPPRRPRRAGPRSSGPARGGRRASSAVSRMSWLVAPRWTWPAAVGADALAQRARQRHHRVAARRRLGAQRAGSKSSARQARRSPRRPRPGRARRPPGRAPAPPRRRASPAARRGRSTAPAHRPAREHAVEQAGVRHGDARRSSRPASSPRRVDAVT